VRRISLLLIVFPALAIACLVASTLVLPVCGGGLSLILLGVAVAFGGLTLQVLDATSVMLLTEVIAAFLLLLGVSSALSAGCGFS